MKVKCHRCGFKGELINGKCAICDFIVEEKPPLIRRLIDKYWSIKGIAIAIGLIILGTLLSEMGLQAIGKLVSGIGKLGIIVIPFGLAFKYIDRLPHFIGEVLIVVGIILGVFSLSMDTSSDGVHNIGLLNSKQNFIIVSAVIFIAGIIITSFKRFVKNKKD